MYDSFTDYDQLNHLQLKRVADALELKNKRKSELKNQIIELQQRLEVQRNRFTNQLTDLQYSNSALKGVITKLKNKIK